MFTSDSLATKTSFIKRKIAKKVGTIIIFFILTLDIQSSYAASENDFLDMDVFFKELKTTSGANFEIISELEQLKIKNQPVDIEKGHEAESIRRILKDYNTLILQNKNSFKIFVISRRDQYQKQIQEPSDLSGFAKNEIRNINTENKRFYGSENDYYEVYKQEIALKRNNLDRALENANSMDEYYAIYKEMNSESIRDPLEHGLIKATSPDEYYQNYVSTIPLVKPELQGFGTVDQYYEVYKTINN